MRYYVFVPRLRSVYGRLTMNCYIYKAATFDSQPLFPPFFDSLARNKDRNLYMLLRIIIVSSFLFCIAVLYRIG